VGCPGAAAASARQVEGRNCKTNGALGVDRLRVHPVPDVSAVRQPEQLGRGTARLERGDVHVGADVGGHEVVRLRAAAAAVVALHLGDRQQHVGVDAGHRAGLLATGTRVRGASASCGLRPDAPAPFTVKRSGAARTRARTPGADEGEGLHGRGPAGRCRLVVSGRWVVPMPGTRVSGVGLPAGCVVGRRRGRPAVGVHGVLSDRRPVANTVGR
jgi:hypothetical protein